MYLSIIGSPQCGKTTLFRALAGAGQNKGGVAVIDVPDERIDRLSGIFHPKKTVYGRVEVCDTEPIQEGDMKAGTIPAELLRQMRPADAFIVVLNGYNAPAAAGASDAASGVHTLVNELMIADMIQIETRLERIRSRQAGKNPRWSRKRRRWSSAWPTLSRARRCAACPFSQLTASNCAVSSSFP